MSYFLNNEQKINDIIFAHRNKNYGAYTIRSTYGNTLFKSLFMVVSVCTVFFAIVYGLSSKNEIIDLTQQLIPSEKIYSVTKIEIPHEKLAAKKAATSETKFPEQSSNQKNRTPVVVDSLAVETHSSTIETPSISSGSTTAISTTTIGGIIGSGTLTSKGTKTIAEIFSVDSEPEFEGGLKALYKFISQNVEYPEVAIEKGKQGTVYIKFVVDEKGKVTDLSLRNSVGYGMDEEALRVVGIIPNFKTPAKAKGQAVKVYYQLPINFKMK